MQMINKIFRVLNVLIIALLAIFILNVNPVISAVDDVTSWTPPARPISKELFSINLIGLNYNAAWPTFSFFGWRNFHSYWDKLEPEKGVWNFVELDNEILLAENHKVETMLVLGSTPTWASVRPTESGCCSEKAPKGNAAEARSINDWRNYVRTIATRYKGRVKHYELWNEPNNPPFYSGTVANLVKINHEAYIVLKEVDPQITVVSSSLSRCCNAMKYFEQYLTLGGGNYADVIGYHFYPAPNPPESMLPQIHKFRNMLQKFGINKPVWNTETGWRIINHDVNKEMETWAGPPLSDEISAAYLARTYILTWNFGIERLYWYAWGHSTMGMTEANLNTPKQIAKTYDIIQKWLIGARMMPLEVDSTGNYICPLIDVNGSKFWIVWNPSKIIKFSIPLGWNISRWSNLFGTIYFLNDLKKLQNVMIGPSPILLGR
jgi:hypothetical protein